MTSVSAQKIATNLAVLKTLYGAFLVLIALKTLVLPVAGKAPNMVIFLLQLIPVLAFAYGIFTHRRRHIAGFCYVLLIYFVGIGANMFVPEGRLYTWLGLVLVVALYASGMMHVRWTRASTGAEAN